MNHAKTDAGGHKEGKKRGQKKRAKKRAKKEGKKRGQNFPRGTRVSPRYLEL